MPGFAISTAIVQTDQTSKTVPLQPVKSFSAIKPVNVSPTHGFVMAKVTVRIVRTNKGVTLLGPVTAASFSARQLETASPVTGSVMVMTTVVIGQTSLTVLPTFGADATNLDANLV